MNGDINQQQSQSKMWFAVVVVILVAVIFVGFYWFGYFEFPSVPLVSEPVPLSEINEIENDLEKINLEGLDQELSDIEAELEAVQ